MGFGRKAKAYLALTKPRVIELLLVSTLPTMIYAERGFPSIGLILATLVGGAFAAGSAGAFNCYIDRDIDKLMHRTENRPLVTGEVTPREALDLLLAAGRGGDRDPLVRGQPALRVAGTRRHRLLRGRSTP